MPVGRARAAEAGKLEENGAWRREVIAGGYAGVKLRSKPISTKHRGFYKWQYYIIVETRGHSQSSNLRRITVVSQICINIGVPVIVIIVWIALIDPVTLIFDLSIPKLVLGLKGQISMSQSQ